MSDTVKFKTEDAAQKALAETGFSLGTIQRDDPRGIMFGDLVIEKWRNLDKQHRVDLHGIYRRMFRGGPVEINLSRRCPPEARKNLIKLADALLSQHTRSTNHDT